MTRYRFRETALLRGREGWRIGGLNRRYSARYRGSGPNIGGGMRRREVAS